MIEAVENHMPEVIIIDEIGTELEAQAARTIAERGVQLVATAHGNTLDNLTINPTLADLIGGIQAVTLGDEEAKRRKTQKTILERKSPPTFDIVVEIQDRNRVAIHPDVGRAVDAIVRQQLPATEVRWLDEDGKVRVEKKTKGAAKKEPPRDLPPGERAALRLYLFGINRKRLQQVAKELKLSLDIVEKMEQASLLVTSKNYYRRRPQRIRDAELANLPIYVLKSHTSAQLRQFLNTIYPAVVTNQNQPDSLKDAPYEAEQAVSQLRQDPQTAVELSPQSAYIRRLQHLTAQRNSLSSQSTGKEPDRRVRIYK